MKKKNNFITGLVVGGLLGVSLGLISIHNMADKKNNDDESSKYTELKKEIKSALNSDIEDEDRIEDVEKKEDKLLSSNKDEEENKEDKANKETGSEMSKIPYNDTSKEVEEKEEMNLDEARNPPREVELKGKKEGKTMGEDFADKLNFSKKINQLEEALKNLREENTK
ncbi:hypothetical protein [Natronospora cellulosivora (SeqCode)]